MQKKYIEITKDIIIIVVVAASFAIFYNFIRTDGISFFKINSKELNVSDGELFFAVDDKKQDSILVKDTVFTISTDSIASDSNEIIEEKFDYEAIFTKSKNSSSGDFKVVNKEQIKRMLIDSNVNQFYFVDARRPELYAKGKIGTAVNIFPGDAEEIVIEKIFALPKDKIIIVYCDGGNCELSHQIAGLLDNFNFKRFFIYEGGWEEWITENN